MSYGYAIGNLATGYVESAAMPVSGGGKYTLSAWLRGQIDWEESPGEWRMRAQFYNSSGGNLGYNDLCYGNSLNTLTWQQQKCLVTPPANAASMKVQLWLVAAGFYRSGEQEMFHLCTKTSLRVKILNESALCFQTERTFVLVAKGHDEQPAILERASIPLPDQGVCGPL